MNYCTAKCKGLMNYCTESDRSLWTIVKQVPGSYELLYSKWQEHMNYCTASVRAL